MNKSELLLLTSALAGMNGVTTLNEEIEKSLTTDRELKECKYSKCDNTHYHNNACCSADHYKLWRAEKRSQS